jgi:hypothetical protein
MHISLELLLRAGILAMRTVGDPGAHGAIVTGMQGIGVNTPRAADVAAATVGFASEEHIPKGIMFVNGMWSMILAMGMVVLIRYMGRTEKEQGAIPKLHLSVAPPHTI